MTRSGQRLVFWASCARSADTRHCASSHVPSRASVPFHGSHFSFICHSFDEEVPAASHSASATASTASTISSCETACTTLFTMMLKTTSR